MYFPLNANNGCRFVVEQGVDAGMGTFLSMRQAFDDLTALRRVYVSRVFGNIKSRVCAPGSDLGPSVPARPRRYGDREVAQFGEG